MQTMQACRSTPGGHFFFASCSIESGEFCARGNELFQRALAVFALMSDQRYLARKALHDGYCCGLLIQGNG